MSRDAARKLGRSPNADHVLVQRDNTGTVQTSQDTQVTGVSTAGSPTGATLTSFSVTDPNLVLNTEGTISLGAGATAGSTLQLTRNGTTTVATQTGSGSTTFGVNTHTTPLNAPSYNLTIDAAGNTASATVTVSREDRWI